MNQTLTMPAPLLRDIYKASDCTDTLDVLNAVATIWERCGESFYQLLTHKAATRRMESLAKRYAVLKDKQSEADAKAAAKYYAVEHFERVFTQLLND